MTMEPLEGGIVCDTQAGVVGNGADDAGYVAGDHPATELTNRGSAKTVERKCESCYS